MSPAHSFETSENKFPVDHPIPAMPQSEDATPIEVLLEDTMPLLFGPDATHQCVYRKLALKYVQKDLQHQSTQRVAGKSTVSIHFFRH